MRSNTLWLVQVVTILMLGGCSRGNTDTEVHKQMIPKKGIMEVQEAHVKSLMSVEGVIGVYIGAKDDGAPCLRVMVKKKTPEVSSKIPSDLEGYPVEIEVTGTIEPFDSTSQH